MASVDLWSGVVVIAVFSFYSLMLFGALGWIVWDLIAGMMKIGGG